MSVTVTELMPGFAAEVSGVDLTRPLDKAARSALQAAIDRHAVLIFRGQPLEDEAQIAFSEGFGALEVSISAHTYQSGQRPEISRLSNVTDDGKHLPPDAAAVVFELANEIWHTDSSFKPVPAKYSLLSAREIPPEGGGTEFADVRAAYEDWPGSESGVTKGELEGLICEHSIHYSRMVITGDVLDPEQKRALPPVRHPLVRRHPGTGRTNAYLGSHASHIVQWPLLQGRDLIYELNVWSTQPRYVYAHTWQQHDLVMWDNRCVLHRGRSFDRARYRRKMHRTTVAGDGPTLAADAPHAQPSAEHPEPGGPHIAHVRG